MMYEENLELKKNFVKGNVYVQSLINMSVCNAIEDLKDESADSNDRKKVVWIELLLPEERILEIAPAEIKTSSEDVRMILKFSYDEARKQFAKFLKKNYGIHIPVNTTDSINPDIVVTLNEWDAFKLKSPLDIIQKVKTCAFITGGVATTLLTFAIIKKIKTLKK